MTREEFLMLLNCIEQNHNEEKLTCTISESDYKIIEEVYTWHPAISDTEGKKEIAALYYIAGMGIITNMYPEANMVNKARLRIQKLEEQLLKEEACISFIKEKYGDFKILKEEKQNAKN